MDRDELLRWTEMTRIQIEFFLAPFRFEWRTGTKNSDHSGRNETKLTTMLQTLKKSTHQLKSK